MNGERPRFLSPEASPKTSPIKFKPSFETGLSLKADRTLKLLKSFKDTEKKSLRVNQSLEIDHQNKRTPPVEATPEEISDEDKKFR